MFLASTLNKEIIIIIKIIMIIIMMMIIIIIIIIIIIMIITINHERQVLCANLNLAVTTILMFNISSTTLIENRSLNTITVYIITLLY